MSPEIYRLLHVVGALLLFAGLGGSLAQAGKDGGKAPALFLAMHGIGLLTMLVAGIGYVHKMNMPWQNWITAKIACWVLLGAAPILVRKGVLPRFAAIVLVVAIGGTAVWLAQTKPF